MKRKTPPGPRGYPLIGSLKEVKKDLTSFITKTSLSYGDIAYFRLGPQKCFLLTNPDYILQVGQNKQNRYGRGPIQQNFKNIIGNGLLASEGAFWRRQRKLIQPAFHRKSLARLSHLMTQATQEMLSQWESYEKNHTSFDMFKEMMHLALEIILKTMFSTQFDGDFEKVNQAISTVLADSIERALKVLRFPLFIPSPQNIRLMSAKKYLDKLLNHIIQSRRQNPSHEHDLLDMLLNAREEGKGMSDKEIFDEVITIFIAGHETTGVNMSWIWYMLSQHPEVFKKLKKELEEVLGGRGPTFNDLPKLNYTRMVIEESMRIYPPVDSMSRAALQADEIGGYPIRKGDLMILGTYPMHHHPKYWKNPEVFDPERFRDENIKKELKGIYFPFGLGANKCIGEHFAMMEAQIILACVAQKYYPQLVPGQRIETYSRVTLRPKYGINMTLKSL